MAEREVKGSKVKTKKGNKESEGIFEQETIRATNEAYVEAGPVRDRFMELVREQSFLSDKERVLQNLGAFEEYALAAFRSTGQYEEWDDPVAYVKGVWNYYELTDEIYDLWPARTDESMARVNALLKEVGLHRNIARYPWGYPVITIASSPGIHSEFSIPRFAINLKEKCKEARAVIQSGDGWNVTGAVMDATECYSKLRLAEMEENYVLGSLQRGGSLNWPAAKRIWFGGRRTGLSRTECDELVQKKVGIDSDTVKTIRSPKRENWENKKPKKVTPSVTF